MGRILILLSKPSQEIKIRIKIKVKNSVSVSRRRAAEGSRVTKQKPAHRRPMRGLPGMRDAACLEGEAEATGHGGGLVIPPAEFAIVIDEGRGALVEHHGKARAEQHAIAADLRATDGERVSCS